MEMVINKDEIRFLKKHVDLILCANHMTLIQRKIFNVLLYKAIPFLKSTSVFQIKISELARLIGYTSRNYVPLVKYINELPSLRMEWRIIDSKTKAEDIISASCAIVTSIFIKDGFCVYKYNDDIKQQLFNPGIYAKLDLNIQALIKSSFGLVMYEICEKYKNIGCTAWIEISKVRQLMGVKDKSYKLFADFEKYVLQRAVDEVNSRSNFSVLFEKKREGRVVKYIKFMIAEVTNSAQLQSKPIKAQITDPGLLRYLVDIAKFKPEAAAIDFIELYGEQLINEQIAIIKNSDLYKSGKVRNMAAMIRDAVKTDGGYQALQPHSEMILEANNKKLKDSQDKLKQQQQQESINKAYSNYIAEKVNLYMQQISEEQALNIKQNFIEYCRLENSTWVEQKALSGDFDSPMVKYPFNKYVVEQELKDRVMSKDQFTKIG